MKELEKYNKKRNFKKTSEPIGLKSNDKKELRFVVQHHLARKDHYDLRLEWNGTMKSWAIPKGPSYNYKDKRLAVQVEDHPLEYRNFEGTIPKGEYGGGVVMIWDEGYWEPIEKVNKNFNNNTIKFILKGKRLKGKWNLIHLENMNWLLIKEKDNIKQKDLTKYKESVRTGRNMKQIEENEIVRKNSEKNHIVESVEITNPDKIIFEKPKITKYDIALYYQKVSKRMISFIENRILSTIRCPEGINGECFFKKHLENVNEGIGMIKIHNNNKQKEDYYYIKDIYGIISEVQMNSFEFHVWGSKISDINSPDVMIFDLDPDEKMPLKKVRQGVKDLKSILDDLKLKSFLKTSGGKGYHVVVPIKEKITWKEVREISKNVAILMETKWPNKYVTNVRKINRKNKVFIDWIRNTKSSTSVAPYSIRMKKGARISMPIFWEELDLIRPNGITMQEAIRRIKKADPWKEFYR